LKSQNPKTLVHLLVEARNGDSDALHRLCGELEGFIRGYFQKRFRDPEVVNDLCQETHVRLLQNIASIRDQMRLRSFVAKVALHVSNDYLRKKYRNRDRQALLTPESEESSSRLSQIAGETTTEATVIARVDLERALEQLSPKSRHILLLKSQGFNYDEISEEFGISVSGVKMQVKRGLAALRLLLFSVTFLVLTTTLVSKTICIFILA